MLAVVAPLPRPAELHITSPFLGKVQRQLSKSFIEYQQRHAMSAPKYQPYAPSPYSYTPSPHSLSTSISLDEEVKLSTSSQQRELNESLAEIYSIIVTLDFLEKAYIKDSINQEV